MTDRVAEWAADEAASAAATMSAIARLDVDLAEHPTSPTLNAVALRDSGRLVGIITPNDALAVAYLDGAPADLVVRAERLRALTDRGRRGWLTRACRLARLVRRTNAAAARYLGRTETGRPVRVLATVTVRLPMDRPAIAAVADLDALSADVGAELVDVDALNPRPPPLAAAATAPVLRTGPPACPRVRPRQAAPKLGAGTHSEGREAALAA